MRFLAQIARLARQTPKLPPKEYVVYWKRPNGTPWMSIDQTGVTTYYDEQGNPKSESCVDQQPRP